MAAVTTQAILLRSFNYSETSKVLRFLTHDHGLMGVMAKGARRAQGRHGGGIETFVTGELTAYVRPTRDLQTFKDFSATRPRRALAGNVLRFAGASMLAELALEHGGEGPAPELFESLDRALDTMNETSESELAAALLGEAWRLVTDLGYEPALDRCLRCGRALEAGEMGRFDLAAGGVRCEGCGEGAVGPRVGPEARRQLRQFLAGEHPASVSHPRAHVRLLADFVAYHLSGHRPLQTFEFLFQVLGPDAPEALERL